MSNIMSLSDFKTLTAKTFSLRNGAIGDIDKALKAYHQSPGPQTLKVLKTAVDAFKTEKDDKYGDFSQSKRESKGGVAQLSDQINKRLNPGSVSMGDIQTGRGNLRQVSQGPVSSFATNQLAYVGKNTRMDGWAYMDWDQATWPWTTAVTSGAQGPLSMAQTSRITEAFRRAKTAIGYAHSAVVELARLPALPSRPLSVEHQSYVDYFGAFDKTRIARVKQNITVLKLAFDRGPTIVDVRDTEYGKGCYAACFRGKVATIDGTTGQATVLSSLQVFLGRAFFLKGALNYGDTTDATVGTLIHEFAHGAIDAVDVPPVNAAGGWTHARKSDDATHRDFGDSTDNSIQASTVELDKLLAMHKPDYALVNADNYGQFAAALLQHHGA